MMQSTDNEARTVAMEKQMYHGYLIGQCIHALKVSLWWTALSPVALAMIQKDAALGAIRVGFNITLLLFCPFAGVLAEKLRVEGILIWSNLLRGITWGILLPLVWLFFDSGYFWEDDSRAISLTLLVFLSCIDGAAVAFSHVVDIDSGGVDLLAQQYNVAVDDEFRNRMNSIFQIVFDTGFLVFTPSIGVLAWYVGKRVDGEHEDDEHDLVTGSIVCVFAGVFLVTTILSLHQYAYHMKAPSSRYQVLPGGDEAEVGAEEQDPGMSIGSLLQGVVDGAILCFKTKPVRWRLFFLGLEVALEDGFVAVVATEFAVSSRFFADGDSGLTLVYTASIVAVGKVGAVLAGKLMHACWVPPRTKSGFFPLFFSVLLSSSSVFLLYGAFVVERLHKEDSGGSAIAWAVRVLVMCGSILFFFFSTAPKIGFATLLQGMASSVDGSGKIFGFVGPFISIMDSILVMLFSLLFQGFKGRCGGDDDKDCLSDNFGIALVITCSIYLVHGLFECFLGPRLMLPARGDGEGAHAMFESLGIAEE